MECVRQGRPLIEGNHENGRQEVAVRCGVKKVALMRKGAASHVYQQREFNRMVRVAGKHSRFAHFFWSFRFT